jgi:hypothetical protein
VEELLELREHVEQQRYTEALDLIGEMEDMSRKSILRNIRTFLVRLLVHLIKNQVEQRLTNSWAASIRGSILEIQDLNQDTHYIKPDEWSHYLEMAYSKALSDASVETLDGKYTPKKLAQLVDKQMLYQTAVKMLTKMHRFDAISLSDAIDAQLLQLPGGDEWGSDRS